MILIRVNIHFNALQGPPALSQQNLPSVLRVKTHLYTWNLTLSFKSTFSFYIHMKRVYYLTASENLLKHACAKLALGMHIYHRYSVVRSRSD